MGELPSGVVTFVFTDIEDSTPLFERLGDRYRSVHARHHELLRDAFARHGGHEMRTEGDSFFVVFADPAEAVASCVDAQRSLAAEPWPHGESLRVRMGVHAGAAVPVDGEYTALPVHAAARVMAAGNGGQIVVSEVVRDIAPHPGTEFIDTGPHRLRGLSNPIRLFRVAAEGMPDDERPLRTARVLTSNLSFATDQLVGREEVLKELLDLLQRNRCVTLTGTGGVGKTSLALHAAASVADDFPEGSWFVDLHALRNSGDVAAALAQLLQADAAVPALQGVIQAVGDGRILLILDNCEHLIDGAAELCRAVLGSCPNAVVVVTSREPLGIAGELTWRVPSLPSADSVALLIARIAAARGSFEPSAADRAGLEEIARQLDGIPLAIELAAARCTAMTPADVAARLSQRFRLLTGGHSSLSRHQTLEAAVSWSFELLDEPTQRVFRRLSVFAGGWTLAEAETVAGFDDLDAFEVFDAVTALVDKSLVVADLAQAPARYTFLETMRQFAQAELLRAGEAEAAHDAHLATFVALIGRLDSEIPGPEENAALVRVGAELDNARAALDWADVRGRVVELCSLTASVQDGAVHLGRGHESMAWNERAIAAAAAAPDGEVPAVLRAKVLLAAAKPGWTYLTGAELALDRLEQAHAIMSTDPSAPPRWRASCASWLGRLLVDRGARERGLAILREARELLVDGDAMQPVFIAMYGRTLIDYDIDRAAGVALLEEAIVRGKAAGTTRAVTTALLGLAFEAAISGEIERLEQTIDRLLLEVEELPAAVAAGVTGMAALELTRAHIHERASELAVRSVELATASGLGNVVTNAGLAAAEAASARGDDEQAEREWLAVKDLALRQSRIEPALVACFRLAFLYGLRGDHVGRRAMLESSRPYAEHLGGMPWLVWSLSLFEVLQAEGNRPAAGAAMRAAFAHVTSDPNNRHVGIMASRISEICLSAGRLDDAARIAAMSYLHSPPYEQRAGASVMHTRVREERDRALQSALGVQRMAELTAEGERMTLDGLRLVTEQLFPDSDG